MTPLDPERLDDLITGCVGIGKTTPPFDFDKWKQEHPEAIREFHEQVNQQKTASRGILSIRRYFMQTRFRKLMAGAAAAAAVIALVAVLHYNTRTAYALEQTIAASKAIHTLHLKFIEVGVDDPLERQCGKELWFEFDAGGRLIRERRQWQSGGKSAVNVWVDGVEKEWSPLGRGPGGGSGGNGGGGSAGGLGAGLSAGGAGSGGGEFRIQYRSLTIGMMESVLAHCDPKAVAETLSALVAAKKMSVEISETQGSDIKLTVRRIVPMKYVPPWWGAEKFIVLIDPVTKRLKQRDSYITRDGREEIDQRWTYLGYNETFDPSLFDLTPPEGAKVIDLTVGKGMHQGSLTDAQAAVAVVRKFIEARVAGDYEQAASLIPSATPQEARDWNEQKGFRTARLVWVGEATPASGMGSRTFEVPYTYEIEYPDGKRELVGPKSEDPKCGGPLQHRAATVCPVPSRPDLWFIVGGL